MKNREYVLAHFGNYKNKIIGITEHGKYKQKEYSHILPDYQAYENIIDVYRESFAKYMQENGIKLHAYFHHLTSSQAVAINFFYPFIAEQRADLILNLFGLSGSVEEMKIEKVLDSKENTCFDFYLLIKNGQKILVEVKYTEDGFGKAKDDFGHRTKYKEIYESKMHKFMKTECITPNHAFRYYQLVRNVSYMDPCKDDMLFVISPCWNNSIKRELDKFLELMDCVAIRKRIKLLRWEDVLDKTKSILSQSSGDGVEQLKVAMNKFEEKYCMIKIPM